MGVVSTINLDRFLHGSSKDKKALAAETDHICSEIGFLSVVGHGVHDSLIQNIYDRSKCFFRGPMNAKLNVSQTKPHIIRGYIGLGKSALGSTIGNDTPPDLKETFSMGPEAVENNPYFSAPGSRSHFAPNLWPVGDPHFKDAWLNYWNAMTKLSENLMQLFAHALGLKTDHFYTQIDRHVSVLSAMFYPDQPNPPEPGQLRAGAHTDFGTMTILKPDNAPGGLQVMTKNGIFEPVSAPPDAFIVNIGDMMARWTNDRWVSTMHRVVNPPIDQKLSTERLSLGFFHQPNYDAVVSCLPNCKEVGKSAKYPPVAAGDHLYAQFSAQARDSEMES